MKNTPFTSIALGLGAKMGPFAGFNMPIEFSGIINEHKSVCSGVGVFDVSHMGELFVSGAEALQYLQNVVSNNVGALADGQAQYAYLPNDNGGITDDIVVYRINKDNFMLVVNAANVDKDIAWCMSLREKYVVFIEDISDKIALLSVQGPSAIKTLQKLTQLDLSKVDYYHFVKGRIAGVNNVIISNTGYTGAGGFELYFNYSFASDMWNKIFEAGEEFGILPVGLGARDTLRLEMGYNLYGNDIDDNISPIEAGLGWVTKFMPGKNFPSRAFLEKQQKEGVARKRVGIKLTEKGVPRHGYKIMDMFENEIGIVTSGSVSPLTKEGIAIGYVKTEFSNPDADILIVVRGKRLKAKVVKLPFRN